MATLTITPEDVKTTDNETVVQKFQAGAAVAQGEPVFSNSSNSDKHEPALNNTASNDVVGIAITPAIADGYFYAVTSGKMDLGATLVTGTVYAVGDAAGDINPVSDLGSADYVTTLGIATSTSEIDIKLHTSGVAIA